jgi:hypothetical protein
MKNQILHGAMMPQAVKGLIPNKKNVFLQYGMDIHFAANRYIFHKIRLIV